MRNHIGANHLPFRHFLDKIYFTCLGLLSCAKKHRFRYGYAYGHRYGDRTTILKKLGYEHSKDKEENNFFILFICYEYEYIHQKTNTTQYMKFMKF